MVKSPKRERTFANASDIAKLLGVDPATVVSWPKRGCPVVSQERLGRKTRWTFDIAAVQEWRKRDLERLAKPLPVIAINDPLSMTKGWVSDDQGRRFMGIMEGLVNPVDD